MSALSNRRILLIDDTPSIHEDFRKILTPTPLRQTADSPDKARRLNTTPIA
ncbi:hypothetical protein [Pseudomonas arsenicoxydans]|uniref:hypothetical protein n=1 Tax=Pseudomonas arsenicoxydans TaxID=702115 RepID=UPI001375DCE0|nr:hypothetical protein [Pseudomonas arsenicoxydans]